MISNTKIEKKITNKTDTLLVRTVIACKKQKAWNKVCQLISNPKRKRIIINLEQINNETKAGEKILIPGKVLSQGYVDKKIKIVALKFSESAKEKLLKAGCELILIDEEIKNNPELKDIKIIK